jgi:hypothetical protein
MGLIYIPYIILEKGKTKNLMKDRENNTNIFEDWDDESLLEEIEQNGYYYKVKFPNYPNIGIDVDGLCKWAKENKYVSLASDEEKDKIKWDGTKKNLLEKKTNTRLLCLLLRKRLTRWVESKQITDTKTGLLTIESPIGPKLSLFYKKLGDGPDKYEWIFPSSIVNTQIYNYSRTILTDPHTYKAIEPIII